MFRASNVQGERSSGRIWHTSTVNSLTPLHLAPVLWCMATSSIVSRPVVGFRRMLMTFPGHWGGHCTRAHQVSKNRRQVSSVSGCRTLTRQHRPLVSPGILYEPSRYSLISPGRMLGILVNAGAEENKANSETGVGL